MVTPSAKREAVVHLCCAFEVSGGGRVPFWGRTHVGFATVAPDLTMQPSERVWVSWLQVSGGGRVPFWGRTHVGFATVAPDLTMQPSERVWVSWLHKAAGSDTGSISFSPA